jgi:hypothetical protein
MIAHCAVGRAVCAAFFKHARLDVDVLWKPFGRGLASERRAQIHFYLFFFSLWREFRNFMFADFE